MYVIDCKFIMSDQKKYINFSEIYRKAYPDLQKEKHLWVVVVAVLVVVVEGGCSKVLNVHREVDGGLIKSNKCK